MCASWAQLAAAPPPRAPAPAAAPEERVPVSVVDANFFIGGSATLLAAAAAGRVVTTPEVLREVRDRASRAALAALPYALETHEPDDEAVRAVVRFARATGDAHALSGADTRLLALARALEVQYYGAAHLRALPAAPRLKARAAREAKELPGWGAQGGEWAEMDRLNEEEAAAAAALLSTGGVAAAEAAAAAAAAAEDAASRVADGVRALSLEAAVAGGDAGAGAAAAAAAAGGGESSSGGESDEDEGGGDAEWVVAAKTRNKQRRARRRSARWAERQAEAAAAESESGEDDEEGASGSDGEGGSEDGSCSEEGGGAPESVAGLGFDSLVEIVTADFAMQNVALQMGLRLTAPDGRRISEAARWALRCGACAAVTAEAGRLFCPRCGNAALDRVRVVVGARGAEQFGVRRKHVLRGTRFPLPKPKGGRAADIILAEDQLIAKAHLLRARAKAEAARTGAVDPFAPEYGEGTWHQKAALPGAGAPGGGVDARAAAVMAGWRRNPNERKHVATNRRRK
jgi:RNA-binding protein NOB1